jgi:hypothetical protein
MLARNDGAEVVDHGDCKQESAVCPDTVLDLSGLELDRSNVPILTALYILGN